MCLQNKIKNFDSLPKLLEVLICSYNFAKQLDNLPNTILELEYSFNQIVNKEPNYFFSMYPNLKLIRQGQNNLIIRPK